MCNSCVALKINGVLCHETGCPDAWKNEQRECGFCGEKFKPEYKNQNCCTQSCYNAYMGFPELNDFESEDEN